MLRKLIGFGMVTALVAGLSLFAACDDDENGGTDPVDPCAGVTSVTILAPAEGATLTVGQPITISWCPGAASSIIVQYSGDGGENISKISEGTSIEASVTTEMTWTPTTATIDGIPGIIYVQNYDNQTGDYDQVNVVVAAQ